MDNLLTTEEKASAKPYLFELFDQKMREGFEIGRAEGFEIGRTEGRAEGTENTIRLFVNKNPDWTDQQIAECFEVTIEFVAKIRTK